MGNTSPLLCVNNLSHTLETRVLFKEVSFSLKEGDFVALVGPNGCGKSTLINLILEESVHPQKKGVCLRATLGHLPQRPTIDRFFPLTVDDALSMSRGTPPLLRLSPKDSQEIDFIMDLFALAPLKKQFLENLSGGEFQRLLLARLILLKKEVLLLDEPFSAVDHTSTHQILNLLKVSPFFKSALVVMHHVHFVRSHFEKTLLIGPRRSFFGLTDEVLTQSNLLACSFEI